VSANDALRLEVLDYTDPDHWRWRLTDAGGKFLADYLVALDPADAEYAAFLDLEAYLEQHAAPDKWPDDEVRLIREVGAWIGQRVLGPVATRILDYGTPVTVRVVVPAAASGLLYRPLELAHARGRPLALHDVSLVFEVAGEAPPVRQRPVGDRLRLLAIFSLPTDVSALALRRERYQFTRLIQRIAQTHGLAIELRILQYGVTRDALQAVLEEGEGWDVIHFSGHGLPASLVLERPDGTRDLVTADDLEALLHPARGHLKLVTLSACLSAAATVEETLRWLGIQPPTSFPKLEEEPGEGGTPTPAVARALVRDLDCAVLAMRYPVGDDFAITLAAELYEKLLGKGQRLPRALQLAVPAALRGGPHPGIPPLSVATPALFGRRVAGLTLKPPPAAATDFAPATTGLAYFPPEPERFVGRVGPMSRASAALAPQSGKTGVLFHGMAGAGKTACALELAYRYATDRFQAFVWHKAPDEGSDIEGALLNLALDMEKQLPGFKMAHLVDRADEFAAWLPRLTELLEQRSILLVLDNLESLLTPAGQWRDERWGQLVAALLAHGGLSRTLLTSRRRPFLAPPTMGGIGGGDESRLLVEPIYALSLSEAALLARELPNLGRLLRGDSPVGLARGRELVARTLAVVQGHPKLIELAEGQAGDPAALAAHLERAAAAWAGGEGRLRAFFQQGESPFEAEDFLAALSGWTQGVAASLPPASRSLFHCLCALEEGDRQSWIVEANWADLWKRLERPGEAPDLVTTLAPLTTAGLVEARPLGENALLYNLHPGVVGAGRAEAGDAFQAAVDAELAAFWRAGFDYGLKEEMRGGGRLVVQAGRSAAPYLLRRERWEEASLLLEGVIQRDPSPATIAAVLPLLRRIAAATEGTERELEDAARLASALLEAGRWREAEAMMRDIARKAAERGEFRTAMSVATYLINILKDTGRAEEALPLVEQKKGYTRRAGLGPWTQLAHEAQRLQLLNALGRYAEVLSAVEALREQMRALPEDSEQEEAANLWNVRETILDTGGFAAMRLERWEAALALNAERVTNQEARGAPALEVARARFNDYGPLLRLGRYGEARGLLHACRAVFEKEGAVTELGAVFSALAGLEDKLGHHGQAIAFSETALRYTYLAGDPEACAISHHNLSNYLKRAGRERKTCLAHRLAAGVIRFQTGSGMLASTLRNLVIDFAQFAPDPPLLPASFDELCRIVEAVDGVHFRELFERLPRRAASGDEALREVVARAIEELGKAGE
jgi:tetratricopeptide (TPR) repeat protein